MKTRRALSLWTAIPVTVALVILLEPGESRAMTNIFFTSSQSTNLVTSGTTSDTLSSEGYLFTFTRDKLFTGGVGLTNPIGRAVRIPWPDGLEAQAVTAGSTPGKARIVIARQDRQPFAIQSFTAELLANTAGAGGAIEVMPQLNGEDAFGNPFAYDASGYARSVFSYNTPQLAGYDTYVMTLYVDFALTRLTVVDSTPPPPQLTMSLLGGTALELSWPTNAPNYSLKCATEVSALVWAPVTNSITTNIDVFTVQVAVSGPHQFFRLQK